MADDRLIVVVADTSPLNYLVQLQQERLLLRLYARVLIPRGVLDELQQAQTPESVRVWAWRLPEWVEVVPVAESQDAALMRLDRGEREAIQLAEEAGAGLLLMDERKATLLARARGLDTVGVLGVLRVAHLREWIDGRAIFERLIRTTTFRYTSALRQHFLGSLDS